MIFRSFFLTFFLFCNLFTLTNFLFADNPMSAIDWLAKKINDHPNFINSSLKFMKKIVVLKKICSS